MTKITDKEADQLADRIEAEIRRLNKLLIGINHSNSSALKIAARDFGDMGKMLPEHITFHVSEQDYKDHWIATLGDYDLDDAYGSGSSPLEAIENLIQMGEDEMHKRLMPASWFQT